MCIRDRYTVTLNYKGHSGTIVERDLNVDDLLEKAHRGEDMLEFEYVHLSVLRLLVILQRADSRKK